MVYGNIYLLNGMNVLIMIIFRTYIPIRGWRKWNLHIERYLLKYLLYLI